MGKRFLLIYLKVLIFLVPLPFGCVGPIFAPMFYFLLLLFALIVFNTDKKELNRGRKESTKPYHSDEYFPSNIFFAKQIKGLFFVFTGFLIFQIIPLPESILKIISPRTVAMITQTQGTFTGWHAISLIPADTLFFLFRFLAIVTFMLALLKIYLRKGELFSIFRLMVISSSLQTIFALIKYTTGSDRFFLFFHKIPVKEGSNFLTGTLGNPDHFAFWLEMIIPLTLTLFFLKIRFLEGRKSIRANILAAFNQNWKVVLYLLMVVLMGSAVVFTGSRAGILTLLLIFTFFTIFSIFSKFSRAVRGKLKFIFIIIGVVIIAVGAQDTLKKSLNSHFEKAGRFQRWPDTVKMVSDFPIFGTGFGTYKYAFFPYDSSRGGKWSTHAHSDFLEVLSDGGVIGSVIFFLLIGFLAASILRLWVKRRHPQIKMMGIGVLCGLFAAVFHSMFDFSLRIPSNIFFLILIIVLGIKMLTYRKVFF